MLITQSPRAYLDYIYIYILIPVLCHMQARSIYICNLAYVDFITIITLPSIYLIHNLLAS
jgi:hypothetical protein